MFSAMRMNKRQLLVLCLCLGGMIFQGTTTVGVLPVYAVRLGADAEATGVFLAFNFFTLMLGNIAGGWLVDRFGHCRPMLLISLVTWLPAALLLTQASDMLRLTLTTGLFWLIGGIAIAILNTITGLSAAEGERGKVFGVIAMAMGVGSLLAGLFSGDIAERWSFTGLLAVMAALAAVILVIALFVQEVSTPTTVQVQRDVQAAQPKQKLNLLVYLVLVACLLSRLGLVISDLGRPLMMTDLGFDAVAVSQVIAVSSAVTLLLPLGMGWLSDQMGHRQFLVVCYTAGAVGVALLIPASVEWQFALSATLTAAIPASFSVAQALVMQFTPAAAMGRSMALLTTTVTIAGIIGFGGGGYVMDLLGRNATILLGAGLPAIAILSVLFIRQTTLRQPLVEGEIPVLP